MIAKIQVEDVIQNATPLYLNVGEVAALSAKDLGDNQVRTEITLKSGRCFLAIGSIDEILNKIGWPHS